MSRRLFPGISVPWNATRVGDSQDDWEPLTKPQEQLWLHFPSAFQGSQGYHFLRAKPTWNLQSGTLKSEIPTLTDLTEKGDGLVLLVRSLQQWCRWEMTVTWVTVVAVQTERTRMI